MAAILSSHAAFGTEIGATTPAVEKREVLSAAQFPIVMAAMLAVIPAAESQSASADAEKSSRSDPQKCADMETDSTLDAWSTNESMSSSDSDVEVDEVHSQTSQTSLCGNSDAPEHIDVKAWGAVGIRLLACLTDEEDEEDDF